MSNMFGAGSGRRYFAATLAVLAGVALSSSVPDRGGTALADTPLAPGLTLPTMNPENGKRLFASKGCVVCHQINGVGGTDAAALDAKTMAPVMSPLDFFAKMWLGAEPMIAMQRDELGGQIEFTGQELADIIAFVHDAAVQQTFSEKDIPAKIKDVMKDDHDSKESESKPGMGMRDRDMMKRK